MLLSAIAWFWIGYFSLGIFIIMEAMVAAWHSVEDHIAIKIIGTIIAVAIWPVFFIK